MSATTSSTRPGPLTALGVKVTVTSLIGEPASRLLTTAEALIGAPTVSVVMLNVETPAASGLYVTVRTSAAAPELSTPSNCSCVMPIPWNWNTSLAFQQKVSPAPAVSTKESKQRLTR